MNTNKIFLNNVGDLAEAQRASYYRFLSMGISEELKNFSNPFLAKVKKPTQKNQTKKQTCLIYFTPSELKVKGPNFPLDTCFRRDISYVIQFYCPGEYSYNSNEKIEKTTDILSIVPESELKNLNQKEIEYTVKKIRVKQDIFFGEIPLMTEEGTFILNGCERVVISQIIRSPGLYFRKEFGTNRKAIYTATLISNKGLWTQFIFDLPSDENKRKENNKKNKKLEHERIYIKLNDFKIKFDLSNEKKTPSDNDKLFIYEILSYFGLKLEEIYDSSKYPTYLENQQLQRQIVREDEQIQDSFSLIQDFFWNQKISSFSIGEIGRYKINKKLGLNLPKEVTYLTSHDFIGILDGLIELKYFGRLSDDIDHIKNKQIRCIGELLQNQVRIGLYRLQEDLIRGSNTASGKKSSFELQNYSNRSNWIVDPRPVTIAVKEFFKASQLSQYMDQVNPLAELTHKRRISVFGPNGLKRDHISTIIRDIHPSQYGRLCPIETPEGQNAGLITSISMFGRVSPLGWIETPYFILKDRIVQSNRQPIFLDPENESGMKIGFCDKGLNKDQTITQEYISVKEDYAFSLKKTKEINFLTISPLQIISLATSLIPFIEHDDANRALMGSNMQRQAVPLMYPQKPIVGTGFESIAVCDSGMVIKTYSEGKVLHSSAQYIEIEDSVHQKIKYYLRKYHRSNQETILNQRPCVWKGEKVFSGQIIADGASTQDGELSLGRNLTIAYMPWDGYNYEDAIIINERLIIDDCLSSIHIEEHETNVSYSATGTEQLTKNLPHLTKFLRRNLGDNGIVQIGSYVKEQDVLVGKLVPCEEDMSPEGRLISALFKKNKKPVRDVSLKVPHGTEGRVIDIRVLSSDFFAKEESAFPTLCEVIRIYIAHIRKIQIGDKLAGRHGNKGIISRILPSNDMPYLPDGTPIDIVFNPLGVPSRMNVGQIFECLLGFAGEKLGKRFKILPFDEIYGKEASRILVNQKLKEAAIKTKSAWIFNSSSPGKILLRDGRTGEYFDNPITVGKSYILKLIHLVEDKIHARATGPYSMITEQPLAGKSQNGGQRFGEMEVWALEAYGCSYTLQELLTVKSDDIDGRNDMYESLLLRKRTEKPLPSIPEAFLALTRELHALGLDFSMQKFNDHFLDSTQIVEKEKDIFRELELRLKLRGLLNQKKAQKFTNNSEEDDYLQKIREIEEKEIIERFKKLVKQNYKEN